MANPTAATRAAQAAEDGAFDPRTGSRDFFFYTHPPVSVSSVAPNANGQIQTDTDSDFYVVAISQQTDIAQAAITESTNPIPLIRVTITDSGSGKALMNAGVPLGALAGDGKRPYRFIRPRLIVGGSNINIAFASYVAAGTTYEVQVILHGYKRYYA
jgi:hypothetical protein